MAGLHNSAFETLFDPSSPSGSTASANSYLSFSALADFRSPQDPSSLEYLEKWQTGSQRPKMDEAAFSDLFFSNPSPFTYSSSGQTDTGMSPWALSPASFGSADAGIPNLPLPQASCSSLGGLNDVLFPEIDLLDAVDPYDCSMSYPSFNMNTRNPSLTNKASNESMLSASSAQSDFLLTPRHSMQKMNHGWDDLAVLPSSSGSSIGYVERVKDSRSGSSSSAWSGGVSLEMEGTNYGDMTHNPGTFPIGLQDFSVAPAADGYALDPSGANAGFMGQNLDWVIEQHPETSAVEKKKADENGQLLPAACIVGNVPGWQASSPTYPSLVDFDNASAPDNLINFKTEPLLSVVAPRPMRPASTGPASSVGQASAAMLGTPMTRRSRSSHGLDNRNSSSLFAFHPVDHSSGSANSAVAGPSTLQAPAPFYHPQQFLTPPQPSGLSSRRSVSGLSIQTSMVTGSDAYSNPYNTSTSTVSNMIPTYINTAPMVEHIPLDSHYDALAGPMSAPLYPSYDTMLPYTPVQARRASPVPAPASVLQPAPGNINVAPPLSADLPPPVVAVEVPTPRATSHKQVEVQPVLTSAPLVMPKARSDAPAATPRTIAALPTKRKVTAPKPRKTSGKKGGAAQPFCSFINFTADDADVISAGVAPSGSKNKRKADDSASPTDSNKRSRQSDSP